MQTTMYLRCSECKRYIKKEGNPLSCIDTFGRCVITNSCKGTLSIVKDPREVIGVSTAVNDWQQRRLLHTHNQKINSSVWMVNHQLDCYPTINVYIMDTIDGIPSLRELTEDEYQIESQSLTAIKIKINRFTTGMVQCLARNATRRTVDERIVAVIEDQYEACLGRDELTLAHPISSTISRVVANFMSPADNTVIEIEAQFGSNTSNLWYPADYAMINLQMYSLSSIFVDPLDLMAMGIDEGSSVTFDIEYNEPIEHPTYLLLTKAPHSHKADLDFSKAFDCKEINNQSAIVYSQNVFMLNTKFKQDMHPHIVIGQGYRLPN